METVGDLSHSNIELMQTDQSINIVVTDSPEKDEVPDMEEGFK